MGDTNNLISHVREEFSVSKRKKPSPREYNRRNTAVAAATGVVTVAAGYIAHKNGLDASILQSEIVPQPPTRTEVVDGMVVVNESLRYGAPVVALGALGTAAYFSITGHLGKKNRALNKLSKIEYSGVDDIQSVTKTDTLSGYAKERASRFKRGAGIAALAIVLTSATSGVEHEVSNGPLRPIDAVADLLSPNGEDYTLVLQDEKNTFMDDSVIAAHKFDAIQQRPEDGIAVIPFTKELMNINDKSALQVALPDETFTYLSGVEIDDTCDTVPVIVDDTVDAEVGETADINGTDVQVVAVQGDMAQMNRSIAIVSDTDMKECLQDGADNSYFGAFVQGGTEQEVKELLESHDLGYLSTVSEADFKENNRDFWRANGTPVLLQLIGYIAIFGGMAAAGERKNALQRNVKEIGIMHAAGVDIRDIRAIEDRRALSETFRATIMAAPAIPAVAAAFNAAELGMKVGVGPRELAVGSMVTLGAKIIASRRAVKSFENNLDLSQAVKG